MRALTDLTKQNEAPLSVERIVLLAEQNQKRIVSKLYQVQHKAVTFALGMLKGQQDSIEIAESEQPAKVIEFIKKWVAKEKVLISHSVKQIVGANGEVSYE